MNWLLASPGAPQLTPPALAVAAVWAGEVCLPPMKWGGLQRERSYYRPSAGDTSRIRPRGEARAGAGPGDGTTIKALAAGARLLVIGRPIREASDPAAAFGGCMAESIGHLGAWPSECGEHGNNPEPPSGEPR